MKWKQNLMQSILTLPTYTDRVSASIFSSADGKGPENIINKVKAYKSWAINSFLLISCHHDFEQVLAQLYYIESILL